jgi:DNA polymerase-3 subunit epsilon
MREVVLDTETTGLSVGNGDRIIEIGCVEVVNRIRTGQYYHIYLNCDKEISIGAQNIHGISKDFLKDKPRFAEIANDFLEFIANSPLVIHNAKFDMKFINNELVLNNQPILTNEVIDTLVIAKKKFPGTKVNLDALCNKFNIDATKREKHGALLDSELLAEVYLELTGGSQISLILDKQESDTSEVSLKNQNNNISFPYREFKVGDQESKLHSKMLEKISSPLWKR